MTIPRSLKFLCLFLMIALLGLLSSASLAQDDAERPLLMAHYMPWYQTPDVSGYWGWHWTMDHFDPSKEVDGRQQIASQFMPLTGPYDSQDETVLEYQVLLMKLSGIDGVIIDWYGTENWRDYATINDATVKLVEMVKKAGLKFIICYEDRTVMNMVDAKYLKREDAQARGAEDIQFAAESWFRDEAYVRHEGQPLLFVFGPLYFRQLTDWETIFAGIEPMPALVTLDKHMDWAALSSYPWPPMQMSGGLVLNPKVLDSYLTLFYRNAQKRDYIVGSAFPAFLDIYEQAEVRSSYGSIDPQDGETLKTTLAKALEQNPDIVQLVTWNDFGEGTVIEPTEETGTQYLEIVQDTRATLDTEFSYTAEDLQLPFRLFTLRREHKGDAEVNARLDEVFNAIVAGDLETARTILDEF